jgi:hypothetical protein
MADVGTEIVNDSDIDSAMGDAKGAIAQANAAPATPAAPVVPPATAPLPGGVSQPSLQGGTAQGATPTAPQAASTMPALQTPQFQLPAFTQSPAATAVMQNHAVNPVSTPPITMPSSNLPPLKEGPKIPEKPWYESMFGNNPLQNAAKGSLGALLGGVDTLDTAAHAIGQPIAQALGGKMEPPMNAEKAYEQTLPPGTTEEPGYQAGKIGTELGGYVAQGALAPELGIPGQLAEGAAWSGVSSAKDQMSHNGNIDPLQTAQAGAVGAAASGLFIGAGQYLGKKVRGAISGRKYQTAKQKLAEEKERLGSIKGKSAEEIAAKGGRSLKEALSDVADKVQTHYEKEIAKLNEITNNNEGATTLQRQEQKALREWEARQTAKTTTKVEGHIVKGEKAIAGELNPQGPHRLRTYAHGFENIEHAEPIENLEKTLGKDHHTTLTQAVEAMGFAKSWVMLLKNDREAYAKNAMAMAHNAAQKAKIEMVEKPELTSAAKETLAKGKAELHLEQTQHIKAQMKAQRDKLIDQIKTSPKKAKQALRGKLAEINRAIDEDIMPEILKIPQEKHLYGIANRAEFEGKEAGRNLANNFDDAFAQFKKADNELKAAEEQYKKLSKDLLPIFAHAEEVMQKQTGELKRLWVRADISHPFQRSVTTPFAVGTEFKGSTATLTGLFAKRYQGMVKEIHANQENFVKEQIYQVGQLVDELEQMHISSAQKEAALEALGAKYEPTKELARALAKSKSLHPGTQKLLLLAGLGLASSDLSASASDGDKEPGGNHNGVYLGGILIGSLLCTKVGIAAAHQLAKSRLFKVCTDYANTRTLVGGADKVLHAAGALNLITHPTESLQHQLNELGGKIMMAINLAPDDSEYLHKAVFDKQGFAEMEKATGTKLSPLGKKFAEEIQEQGKMFRAFITKYNKGWNAHIAKLPEKDQKALQEITDAVHFMDGFMNPQGAKNDFDRFLGEQVARTSKAIFYANLKQAILNMVANVAINGPLQVGPNAVAAAFKSYSSNSKLRGLVNAVIHGGSQSAYLQEVSAKAKPLMTEAQANRFMTLASFAHYFDMHPNEMKHIRARTWEDFATKAMEGKLPHEIGMDVFTQLYVDITETLGGDPLRLVMGPASRSMSGHFARYFADIERYKALFLINWNKRNYKWLAASLLMLQQFGGKSVLPIEAQIGGLALNAAGMAAVFAFLDNWSLIGHTIGDMSHSLGWGLLIPPPAMGQIMPGVSNVLDMMNGLEQGAANLPEIFHAIANGGLMGDPANETNEKAQKAFRSAISLIAQAYPTVQDIPFLKNAPSIPLEGISAALYHLPKLTHNEMAISVPNPVALGSGAHPLAASKILHAPKMFGPLSTAQWESLRGITRFPSGIDATEFKDYGIGKALAKRNPEMVRKQAATGIH